MAVDNKTQHLEPGKWPKHVGKFGTPPLRKSRSGGNLEAFISESGYSKPKCDSPPVPTVVIENGLIQDVELEQVTTYIHVHVLHNTSIL